MWQVMEKRNIFSSWFLWHYVLALKELFLRWKDLLYFNLNYFSIPFLLRTLFSPWRKTEVSYGRGFDAGRLFNALVFNIFSRIMGSIVRFLVIIVGLLTQVSIFFLGFFAIFLWIIFPLVIIFGVFTSLQWLIFS